MVQTLWRITVVIALTISTLAIAPDPQAVANGLVQMATGTTHSCAIESGKAQCWGDNSFGALGDGTTLNSLVPVTVAQPAGVLFSSIGAGGVFTCALTPQGSAYCWGAGNNGRMGNGGTANSNVPTPVSQPAGVTFTSLAVGSAHACGVTSGGQAYCWGYGATGRLGTGNTNDQLTPAPVSQPGGVTFASIAAGGLHTCGLTTGGKSYCWGSGTNGRLGNGLTSDQLTPVATTQGAGVDFASISAGGFHTCGVTSAGQAHCWGAGALGRIGDNGTSDRTTPTPVTQPAGVTFSTIATGDAHTCALTGSGTAYCWGSNSNGRLGDGTTNTRFTPVAVLGYRAFVSLSLGSNTRATCASTNVEVFCWGLNSNGQLGNASTTDSLQPTKVSYTSTGTSIEMTASVAMNLAFSLTHRGSACNGVTPNVVSTSASINFGTFNPGTTMTAAHDLTVETNAMMGFTVFVSGTPLSGPRTMNSVTGTNEAPAAFGLGERFGYTTNDTNVPGFAGPLWAAIVPANKPVMSRPVTFDLVRSNCVAYQLSTSETTPSGSYTGSVTYTLVPTF